jgi:hypothetical protein
VDWVVDGSGGGTSRLGEIGRVGSNFVLWREFIYTVRNSFYVERTIKSLLKRSKGLNCSSLGVVLLFKPNVSNPADTGVEKEVISAVLEKICIWPVVEAMESDNVVKLLSVGSVGVMLGAIVLGNCMPEEVGREGVNTNEGSFGVLKSEVIMFGTFGTFERLVKFTGGEEVVVVVVVEVIVLKKSKCDVIDLGG